MTVSLLDVLTSRCKSSILVSKSAILNVEPFDDWYFQPNSKASTSSSSNDVKSSGSGDVLRRLKPPALKERLQLAYRLELSFNSYLAPILGDKLSVVNFVSPGFVASEKSKTQSPLLTRQFGSVCCLSKIEATSTSFFSSL